MGKKNTTVTEENTPSGRIRKLNSKIRGNLIVAVIFEVLTAGMVVAAVMGLAKGGVPLFVGMLFFALIGEVFAISLFKENKELRGRIQAEQRMLDSKTVFAEPLYKNKGYTYSTACELYCRKTGKAEKDLTKEDERIIWQNSYDDFAYLLMWIIENDLYQPTKDHDEDSAREAKSLVNLIKSRKEVPTAYLEGYEGYFMEDEVKKKARDFVIEYYRGSYDAEVRAFAREKLDSELYGFPFRWEDYDAFKENIDKAYEEFNA